MWDQPTEPTLVGAPIGHPDGSFGMAGLWGSSVSVAPNSASAAMNRTNSAAAALQQQQQQQQQQSGPKMEPNGGVVPGSGWGAGPSLSVSANKQQTPTGVGQSSWNSTPGNVNAASIKNGMIVAAAAANGWDHAAPVMPPSAGAQTGGWGAPSSASTLPMSWNSGAANNSQWETTNSSGGASSWSQIASKNVQTAGRAKSGNYESSVGWGSQPVDQGTPWCSLENSGGVKNSNNKDWHGHGHGHGHGSGAGAGAGTPSWEPKDDPSSWHHSNPKEKSGGNDGSSFWKGNNGGGGHRGSSSGQGQWNNEHVTSGSGWDSLPPQSNRSWNNNPEPVTPSNVWTGPPTDTCVDSSMVWNNPNPKKVAQPDKGTNFWGDPTLQSEIKRWKACSDEPGSTGGGGVVSGTAPAPTTASGGGSSSAGVSVWKETPMAPQPQVQKSVSVGWNDPPNVAGGSSGGLKPTSDPNNGAILWGDSAPKNNTPAQSGWMNVNDNGGWTANKPTSLNLPNKPPTNWPSSTCQTSNNNQIINSPTNNASSSNASNFMQMPANNKSIALTQMDLHHRSPTENDSSNDDVFSSNPTTPMNVKNGMNPANYQRMTQQLQQQQQQSGKILQNMQAAANNQQIQILTKQIASQLKSACDAGLIDASMLDNQLPQETLVRLNYLLQSIPKLEQAQRELHQLQRQNSPLNPTQSQEMQRLSNEQKLHSQVHQYQTMIQTMKAQISAQTAFFNKTRSSAINIGPGSSAPGGGGPPGSANHLASAAAAAANRMTNCNDAVSPQSNMSSGDSLNQSKLLQWKNANGSSASEEGDKKNSLVTSPSASNLENLVQSMATASLNVENCAINNDPWSNSKRNSAPDWPMSNKNSESMATKNDEGLGDKSLNDSQTPVASKEGSLNPDEQRGPGNNNNTHNNNMNESGMGDLINPGGKTGGDEGPPEFRPGQKWLWKDPKEMAEDPNATPGSIKPSTLTLNTNLTSFNAAAAASHQQFMLSHNLMNNPGLAHHHSFSGSNSNSLFANHGKMGDDLKPSATNADFYAASRMNAGRMPPANQMGQSPYGARPPMIKQQFSVPNAFVPYNNFAQQWIVLTITNISQIDEHALQLLVNSYGTTQTYISPPGSGLAFVKFRDVPLDRVLSKMQQEFTPLGVTIQMTKDSEVERLLQAFNTGAARQPPMFNAPSAGAHGLLGPRHAAAAAAGMLWDAPPPAGPWATSNPPPPHPYGPPLGPLPDQMAQLMQQQQSMMHDSSVGGLMVPPDRHPF